MEGIMKKLVYTIAAVVGMFGVSDGMMVSGLPEEEVRIFQKSLTHIISSSPLMHLAVAKQPLDSFEHIIKLGKIAEEEMKKVRKNITQLHTALEALDPISSIALAAVDSTNPKMQFFIDAQNDARAIIEKQLSWINSLLCKENLRDYKEILLYAYLIDKSHIEGYVGIRSVLLEYYATSDLVDSAKKLKEDVELEGGY
jgi:uncharacterized membrane protein YcaP (DUF421 family)